MTYPKSKSLVRVCRVVVCAWCLIPLLPVGIYLFLHYHEPLFFYVPLGLFLAFAVVHFIQSFGHRCPSCRKFFLISGIRPPHPQSRTVKGFRGWAAVVLDVLLHRRFAPPPRGAPFEVVKEGEPPGGGGGGQ